MAIVKMAKLRVIGLLNDKERVYNYLQNKANVHIKTADKFENTKTKNTDEQVERLQNERARIDELILFFEDFMQNQNDFEISFEDMIEEGKQCQCVEELEKIKIEIDKINKYINENNELIVVLLKNGKEMVSDLVKNKVITLKNKDFNDCTALEMVKNIRNDNERLKNRLSQIKENVLNNIKIESFKAKSEFLAHEIQNTECDGKIRMTERTFIMEFYTPQQEIGDLVERLENLSNTLVCEEVKIKKTDNVPTLTKNGKLTRQAEFVTNMYSVPSYHEVDPNKLMFWFYMIFFGYIMADIGLGICLIIIGYTLARKQKSKGVGLWNLIGTGGFFAIFWGFLYRSFFGFTIEFLPQMLPDAQNNAILTLLMCLLMGIAHISCGYFMAGLNAIKRGSVTDAIFDCFLWDTFFIGMTMCASKFLLSFFNIVDFNTTGTLQSFLTAIAIPGLILMVASLVLIMVFAGRKTKNIFGKLIKAFTSMYGIINLFSDILSYARLFGLMLSGAIIGSQFDAIGVGLIQGGSIFGILMGGFVIVIGNTFNLAMGALGAYIHDCRLQYIEYFGKCPI